MKRCLIGALFLCFAITSLADDSTHQMRHRPVRVFDANGHVVGDLTIFAAQNGVAFTVGHATAVVPIGRVQDASRHFSATDFQWQAAVGAFFTSSDCSGYPIVNATSGPWAALALRRDNVVTLYFAVEGVDQVLMANSILDPTTGCRPFTQGVTVQGWPAGSKLVISEKHPEPLRIGF